MANGLVAITRACARRSRDAATIFIAFVICCVDLTARTRRRMSISDGMLRRGALSGRGERIREFLQRLRQLGLDLIVDLLLVGERRQQLRATRVEELVQLGFVVASLL